MKKIEKIKKIGILCISIFSLSILCSFNTPYVLNDSKINTPVLIKLPVSTKIYEYSLHIQSQVFFINGCFYRVRATLTFEWDGIPGHPATSASITNVQLIQDCPSSSTQSYYTRTSSFSYDTGSRATSSLSFETLENSILDAALTNNDLINDIKNQIDDSIDSVTDN